ncbi:MAG: ABC transporter permease [Alphaproteobacteria bacterium]|nr:ABC transporter permease [Alphaproteobacteria bacterium]
MSAYLVRRALQAVAVLAAMSLLVHVLLALMPGDPVDLMAAGDPRMTAADLQRLRELHGVDRPMLERYLAWAGTALQGDFGWSRAFRRPVLEVIAPRLWNTVLLMGSALALALAIGLPLGIWAAAREGSMVDRVVNLACFAGAATPTFWLALLLMMLFAVQLGWLPAGGLPPARSGLAGSLRHMALPVATLALAEAGIYARHLRAAMVEALAEDHVRTARAKGASRLRVLLVHALRNAMIPVATVAALGFGGLFSGALVTETMFAWPGMGKLIYDSILGSDFNVALVALLFATLLTLLGSLLADIACAALDPRISLAEAGRE